MTSSERFLVTGAMGCIGSWTIRVLLDEGIETVAFDVSESRHRLQLLLTDEELNSVRFVRADVTDGEVLRDLLRRHRITHVVHLAALQVPFCRRDPVGGAQINVVGTTNLFEAVRAMDDEIGLSYASSLAVFGSADQYSRGMVTDQSPPAPTTLYGVYKQANEWTARIYAEDYGIGSVGMRPAIVYGVGRDQGMTSGVTKAMLAAVAGRPFRVPHGGGSIFQYAPDVARFFVAASRARPREAQVLNIGGSHVSVAEVLAAIDVAAPGAASLLSHEEEALPFPTAVDASGLERLIGPVTYTSLMEGVAETVKRFNELLRQDRISL